MRKIAHIVNPILVNQSSDLFYAQPITFETMRRAKQEAKGHVEVELLAALYPEDISVVPNDFIVTPELSQSVLDFGVFENKRKLPILKDILDRLYEASDAEYLIYSNVDIALMPHFYIAVDKLIDEGYDAFVINRRTISDEYKSIDEIPLMYFEPGEPHPGHDCFIFRREDYPLYRLANLCLGINWVGRALILNLACHAKNFKEFKDKHLTFHIGNEQIWKSDQNSDYVTYNKSEILIILSELEKEYGPFDEKGALYEYFNDILKDEKEEKKPNIDNHSVFRSLINKLRTISGSSKE